MNDTGHMLQKKALKALNCLLYKLYRFKFCNPAIMVDLYDKMILPFAVWGTMSLPVNENITNLMGVSTEKNPVYHYQIKFRKVVLVVDDK